MAELPNAKSTHKAKAKARSSHWLDKAEPIGKNEAFAAAAYRDALEKRYTLKEGS